MSTEVTSLCSSTASASSMMVPDFERGGVCVCVCVCARARAVYVYLRAEHSVSYYLYIDQLWVSVLITIYCK